MTITNAKNYLHQLLSWQQFTRPLFCVRFAIFLALFSGGAAQALPSVDPSCAAVQKPLTTHQVQKDTLVVGSEQGTPDVNDATSAGFSVDLWKAVAKEAGLNYTMRVLPFQQLFQEFREGKIDVMINLVYSDERHHSTDFTVPHFIAHQAIFVRKGESGIRTEDDLAGKSIISLNSDMAQDYAVSKGWAKQLVLVNTPAEGLRLLASGKHDAMLLSKLAGIKTLQILRLNNIEALDIKVGGTQKFAFAVAEGQSELLGRINEGLMLTKTNGTYDALYEKWFALYETKEVGLRDMLKYLIIIVAVFTGISGYFFYKRKIERKEAEKKYRTLVAELHVGVLIQSPTSEIILSNKSALELLGLTEDQLLGKTPFDPEWNVIHEDGTPFPKADHPVSQSIATRQPVNNVVMGVYRPSVRDTVWLLANAEPELNPDGSVQQVLCTFTDITERKQAEQQLLDMSAGLEKTVDERTQQLRTVAAQLTMTEERERRMLAQDLHDNLGQLLAVIKIKLTSAKADLLQPSVNHIVEMVDQADQAVRTITLQLSPPVLQTLGLMPALEWLAEDMKLRYGLAVDIVNEHCEKQLDDDVRAVLFRSVRELLINVYKHAKVSNASVSCMADENGMTVVVSDSGCGFDSTNPLDTLFAHHGFGLSSIYERMTIIGGAMTIESSPGNGTSITLTMPYNTATKERKRHD